MYKQRMKNSCWLVMVVGAVGRRNGRNSNNNRVETNFRRRSSNRISHLPEQPNTLGRLTTTGNQCWNARRSSMSFEIRYVSGINHNMARAFTAALLFLVLVLSLLLLLLPLLPMPLVAFPKIVVAYRRSPPKNESLSSHRFE